MGDPPSASTSGAVATHAQGVATQGLGCAAFSLLCAPVPVLFARLARGTPARLFGLPLALYCLTMVLVVGLRAPGRAVWLIAALVVVGYVSTLVYGLVPHGARPGARQRACLRNLRGMRLAFPAYRSQRRAFPEAEDWCDELTRHMYVDHLDLVCPESVSSIGSSYAMNADLSQAGAVDLPFDTVLIFESDLGWNGADEPDDLPAEPRHPDGYAVLFTDGAVRMVLPDKVDELRWAVPPALREARLVARCTGPDYPGGE